MWTNRPNWNMITFWGQWNKSGDTAYQTQHAKFKTWQSETSGPRKWKWNEWGFIPPLCTYRLNWARITWGGARYFSAAEALHNIECSRVSGEETSLFLWNLKARVGLEPEISDFPGSRTGSLTAPPVPPPFWATECSHTTKYSRVDREAMFCFFEIWTPRRAHWQDL